MLKNNISLLFSTVLILIFCASCTQQPQQVKFACPYLRLEGNLVEKQSKREKLQSLGIGIDAKARANVLKKIAELTGVASLGIELRNLDSAVTNTTVEYDGEFLKRWNALREDICGSLATLENNALSLESRKTIEKGLIPKINAFARTILEQEKEETPKMDSSPRGLFSLPANKAIELKREQIEISLQLAYSTNGFTDIYVDGKKALILPNSTKFNPRLMVDSKPRVNQSIIIHTQSGNSCLVERVFSKSEQRRSPARIKPSCNH